MRFRCDIRNYVAHAHTFHISTDAVWFYAMSKSLFNVVLHSVGGWCSMRCLEETLCRCLG